MENTIVLICLMKHMIVNQTVSIKKLLEKVKHLHLLHKYHFVCLCATAFTVAGISGNDGNPPACLSIKSIVMSN